MLKKSVSFDENKNQIKYYEKEKINYYDDYSSTICKYMCVSTECDERLYDSEYIVLKNGKKVKRVI